MFFYFHAVYIRELVAKKDKKTRAFNELLEGERMNERH